MASVRSHENIELMTYSEVIEVSGYVGNFKVKIRKKPRYVDESKCTGCGTCQEKCPAKTTSEFDLGLGQRKAIYIPFPQAVPNVPVIDPETCIYFTKGKCRACEKLCEAKAIDFEQTEKIVEVDVGAIIITTGFDSLDPSVMVPFGYGRYDNVITGIQFERMSNAAGPTNGKIVLKDGSTPHSVAILHCIGSRDVNYHEYCSRVCYYKGKRTLIEKQCAACGKGISVQRSKVYDNNFCSNECFHNFQKTGKYIDCDNCGKRIYKSPAFLRNSRNFCSQKCFGMGSRSKNYETNKTGRRGTNWNKQRTKAQLRDNKTCQICGYHQHKRMKRRYIDVHHIIPFRHFGGNWKEANVLSNLICLCRDCHVKVEAGEIPCPRPLF